MQGAPKGLALVDGLPIVERVAAALRPVTDGLLLSVGNTDVAAALPGVARVHDAISGAGPLAGIHAALRATQGAVLVCAWDMPFVSPLLLAELRRVGELGNDAVIPAGVDERPEPLCAWYSFSALSAIERRLGGATSGSVVAALVGCALRVIPLAEVQRFADPRTMFSNINTHEDLLAVSGNRYPVPG